MGYMTFFEKKFHSVRAFNMASAPKRAISSGNIPLDEVLEMVCEDSDHGGISKGEESEIDRQLGDSFDEWR